MNKFKNEIPTTEILNDYKLACLSRELSIQGRKEVLNGKAKFGIFGDGKEIAQIAYAKYFRKGDFRSGYYRDQTFMLAAGLITPEQLFAQVYGDTDINNNPDSGGRLMNNHFGTPNVGADGKMLNTANQKNSSSDISPTAGQIPRLIGLALASKLYRQNPDLNKHTQFSVNGNEVAFGSIGDASTSEGHFFEILNAAGVLQVPMALAVWDDGYGISVPREIQTLKNSISELCKGFEKTDSKPGILIYKVNGWDYEGLVRAFGEGIASCREKHIPVLFHIDEMTQPLGHSSSGSHERYKSTERLAWEKEFDPIKKFGEWIVDNNIATNEQLTDINTEAIAEVKKAKERAWNAYIQPLRAERDDLQKLIDKIECNDGSQRNVKIIKHRNDLKQIINPIRKDMFVVAKKVLRNINNNAVNNDIKSKLINWIETNYQLNHNRYSSHVYCEAHHSALSVAAKLPVFSNSDQTVPGREILRNNFDCLLEKNPLLVIFGEDVGKIGSVNQCLEGLQAKHGELRIFDTGIREISIVGKAIGLALRGLRPIAEIQYFDYLLYAIQTMSDDVATLHYRTKGQQIAPLIIRTRGHRLEGVWHSGSPLSMVINSIRGMYVCVPRNMVQASGFYNTLLEANDPALVIEPLNGYRLHEKQPTNLGEYKTPLGIPEIIVEGTDITIVTYGSCVRIAEASAKQLREFDISCEVIDVQTLLPFDVNKKILESIKKTHRVLFFDEDVPGGATAFMMQKVVEEQNAFYHLDAMPHTLSAHEHRPAYGTDGDYFSKPNEEDLFEAVYRMMHNANPAKYPEIYATKNT